MSGQLPLQPVLQAEGLPAGRLYYVAPYRGSFPPTSGLAGTAARRYPYLNGISAILIILGHLIILIFLFIGYCIYQSSQRSVCLPVGAGLR